VQVVLINLRLIRLSFIERKDGAVAPIVKKLLTTRLRTEITKDNRRK
jgi:hypothetical protein